MTTSYQSLSCTSVLKSPNPSPKSPQRAAYFCTHSYAAPAPTPILARIKAPNPNLSIALTLVPSLAPPLEASFGVTLSKDQPLAGPHGMIVTLATARAGTAQERLAGQGMLRRRRVCIGPSMTRVDGGCEPSVGRGPGPVGSVLATMPILPCPSLYLSPLPRGTQEQHSRLYTALLGHAIGQYSTLVRRLDEATRNRNRNLNPNPNPDPDPDPGPGPGPDPDSANGAELLTNQSQ